MEKFDSQVVDFSANWTGNLAATVAFIPPDTPVPIITPQTLIVNSQQCLIASVADLLGQCFFQPGLVYRKKPTLLEEKVEAEEEKEEEDKLKKHSWASWKLPLDRFSCQRAVEFGLLNFVYSVEGSILSRLFLQHVPTPAGRLLVNLATFVPLLLLENMLYREIRLRGETDGKHLAWLFTRNMAVCIPVYLFWNGMSLIAVLTLDPVVLMVMFPVIQFLGNLEYDRYLYAPVDVPENYEWSMGSLIPFFGLRRPAAPPPPPLAEEKGKAEVV